MAARSRIRDSKLRKTGIYIYIYIRDFQFVTKLKIPGSGHLPKHSMGTGI